MKLTRTAIFAITFWAAAFAFIAIDWSRATPHNRFDEPPPWQQTARQSLGAVLLVANKPTEAEAMYREDLARYPENGWSLYGLTQALRAQKKTSEASSVEARFRKTWSKSDMKLQASRY